MTNIFDTTNSQIIIVTVFNSPMKPNSMYAGRCMVLIDSINPTNNIE